MHLVSMWHCFVKTLPRKTHWDKNLDERKRVRCVDLLMTRSPWWDKLYFQHVTSLRRHISILCTTFLNVDVSNAFVNKSVRLSLDRICWISTIASLLELMCVEKLRWYVFDHVSFNVASCTLCNTSNIIFKQFCWSIFRWGQSTWFSNMLDHRP